MKILSYAGLLVGLAALAGMVAWQGFGTVGGTLASTGWGLLLLPLVWLPHVAVSAASWRLLFAPRRAPSFGQAVGAMWMGRSVNTLLPVASIGGEVIQARVLMLWGGRGPDAGASVVVDKTVQAMSLLLWALIGIGVLIWLAADDWLVAAALGGFVLFAGGVAGFVIVQRAGMFGFLAKSAAKVMKTDYWSELADSAAEVDEAIRALYRRPGRVGLACGLRLAARVLLTGEIWLAAYLMGHPITLMEALMLKSLSGALNGAAFVVPNGFGVQEGGYVLLGALVGLSPEFMLAVSLATRVRELLVSVPGLLAWQHAEGRALWRRLAPDSRRRAG